MSLRLILRASPSPKFRTAQQQQGKHAEAESLHGKIQKVVEKALGPDHPDVAAVLVNRAGLLETQVKTSNMELIRMLCCGLC